MTPDNASALAQAATFVAVLLVIVLLAGIVAMTRGGRR